MPVWHELTRAARESGRLTVVGLVQEQHPRRARLFAQWKHFDWPILWDPFNLTGSGVVPRAILIDEHGVVRSLRADPDTLARDFLDVDFAAPAGATLDSGTSPADATASLASSGPPDGDPRAAALAELLFSPTTRAGGDALDDAVTDLLRHTATHPQDAPAWFQLGVARRMRFDSHRPSPGDFQGALDAWARALALNPAQYIWRRRIQQYGPRLDKPYPFYDWIDTAQGEITARGETPLVLEVTLTGAERARPRRETLAASAQGTPTNPDPEAGVPQDLTPLIDVESAVAFDTSGGRPVARVHVSLRPRAAAGGHWNNEAEPLRIWIGGPGATEELVPERRLLEHPNAPVDVSDETRHLDFELEIAPARLAAATADAPLALPAYALFNACSDDDGTCRFLRRDFTISLSP